MGELDTNANKVADNEEKQSEAEPLVENVVAPDPMSLPYLLLDIRDSDAFEQSHIIGGKYVVYFIIKKYFTRLAGHKSSIYKRKDNITLL